MASDSILRRNILRTVGWIGLGFIVLCEPTATFAANKCPWMNEATASSLLGGDAVGAYSPLGTNQPAVCTFTQNAADVTRILKITVEVAQDDPHARLMKSESACGSSASPLKAIGNEAVTCAVEEPPEIRGARAVGRVRDQLFEILITTTRTDDPILTRDALRIRIGSASEQVSGNLF